jgi:hypothetical protein
MQTYLLVIAWSGFALGNPTCSQSPPEKDHASATVVPVMVQHLEVGDHAAWAIAQTANFRIFHKQSPDLAARVGQTAEWTRTAMCRKWFGKPLADWTPRCDIYLHATARDYSLATGVPEAVPGHSTFRFDSGRLLSRRIDLHCDFPAMLTAVLPHETTHAVLRGMFGETALPRWADEGMAALAEAPPQIREQLDRLPRCRQAGQLFTSQELMEMKDYPARRVTAFYAQSVSLVAFLTASRSPEVLTRFLRESAEHGCDLALRHHYGWDFAELERHWQTYAFAKDHIASLP